MDPILEPITDQLENKTLGEGMEEPVEEIEAEKNPTSFFDENRLLEPTCSNTTTSISNHNLTEGDIATVEEKRNSSNTITSKECGMIIEKQSSSNTIISEATSTSTRISEPKLIRRKSSTVTKETESKKQKIVEEPSTNSGFSCNICFDTASNPVLTLCGHLYCWSCLHLWLRSQPQNPLCPVCKAGCGKDKVIPVYGRGSDMKDPRLEESIPERPKGQRPEANSARRPLIWESYIETDVSFRYPGLLNIVQDLFPNLEARRNYNVRLNQGRREMEQQAFLSRLFLLIGALLVASSFFD
ncbi:hypothetical protein K502DRAFT_323506 [Neoconidiobolus thromboides FSU 785]|nr:hypothetical protein K502DRAFT_323506 [Neoconidiobolus thromboides FSU 785]